MEAAYYYINHYLVPHHSNNHKAKALHSKTIFIVVLFLLLFQISLTYLLPKSGIKILGYASSIPAEEVVMLTNQKRAEAGLAALTYDDTLTQAARKKGEDMLERDYWAHVAPDGTEPWKFFIDVGYNYRYAGENLARDFTNPTSTVDAWMASPTHKDNMLSPKYKEIGIAVVEGDLNGVDTTIVIQLFGARHADVVSEPVADSAGVSTELLEDNNTSQLTTQALAVASPIPSPAYYEKPSVASQTINESGSEVLVSPFIATKTVSLVVTGFLLLILVVDAVVISRRRIARVSGRTLAHMAFIGMIITVAIILKAGRIV